MGVLCSSGCAQQAGFPVGGVLEGNQSGSVGGTDQGERKSPARLQLEVMDFSDFFVVSTGAALDEILAAESDPVRRVALLTWKVRYTSASMEIASGADPRTSLLDMAIFVSAGRWALDRYWVPEIFGPEGRRLQPVYAALDSRIWELLDGRLTPEQAELLRDLVRQWTRENPPSFEIAGLRFRNLEGVQAADFRPPRNAQGLLASVRSWLGEVNTSLLFGERILFYLGRTPRVLTQQTDLTLAQIAENFPLTRVDPDFPALAGYVEGLPVRLLEELAEAWSLQPGSLSLEGWPVRETLRDTQSLVESSSTLVSGATELVAASTTLSVELQATLEQVRRIEEQLNLGSLDPEEWQPPLDSLATSIASIEKTVLALQSLLVLDTEGSTAAARLLQEGEDHVNAVIDRAFLRLVILIGLVFLSGCVWILLCWILLLRRGRKPSASPPGEEPSVRHEKQST